MIKIDLPEVIVKKEAEAHPYPFQIAYQSQELIQGAMFYSFIADVSCGKYIKQKDALNELEISFLSNNGEKGTWELGWKLLGKYKEVYKIIVFQNVLISINSYWDWYIRNLGKFVIMARAYVQSPSLNKKDNKNLDRLGYLQICQQIEMLEKVCNISFRISKDELLLLNEMSLVRNLALHNRWEVDDIYLKSTAYPKNWQSGELRLFDSSELGLWHKTLITAINRTSLMIAIKYCKAPDYP